MNILVIAPHPDDESIGCGGTLCLHQARGDRTAIVYLTSGELGLKKMPRKQAWHIREGEARAAGKILGAKKSYFLRQSDWAVGDDIDRAAKALRSVIKIESPHIIYVPHPGEWHPDHKAALDVLRKALQANGAHTPSLRGYEVWTPLLEFDHLENITGVMPRKMRAIQSHRSQLEEAAYDRAIRGLNAYRGVMEGKCHYAEVFQSL